MTHPSFPSAPPTDDSEDHPDARAVMYETGRYNERKIRDFLSALDGLRTAAKYVHDRVGLGLSTD